MTKKTAEPQTALTLPERAKAAIAYEGEKALLAQVETSKHLTTITNQDAREQVHRARMVLKNGRVEIEKRGKAARADANAFRDAVISEEKRLIAIIEPEEERLAKIQVAWDSRIEAERLAKVKAEQERVAAIQGRITDMHTAVNGAARARTAADVQRILDAIDAIVIDQSFAEFSDVAADTKASVYEQIKATHESFVAREAESARLAAERAELDKQRAEQEARDKVERDRIAAEEAAATKARRAEVELASTRMSEIHAMGHQVIIATAGRLGVRAGGTRECIVETLAETDKWTVDEEKFGSLLPMAQAAKNSACAMIRGLLDSFDSRADTQRVEAEQDAAQKRIDDANAELAQRQREDQERREKVERAEREERERAARAAEAEAERQRKANFVPTLSEMLAVLADEYERDVDTVDGWVRAAYSGTRKAA